MTEPHVGLMFWILGFVIVASSIMVVTLKNIFHCALALIVALSGVAGIYILLNAEFLAAVQVLIYVGAVATLMIFSVMLTSQLASKAIIQTNRNWLLALLASFMFVIVGFILVEGTHIWNKQAAPLPDQNTLAIGKLLMTDFMLPFEIVSVLMLAAMIGAIVLARGERS
ncbi:MAG: NADH-quinone oxidoreductase subunit J [Candidatus Zixiibacteriota bacterium]